MEKLSYISSAGLRGLLMMKKKIAGDVTVMNVCKTVNEIFSQTGFDGILKVTSRS